jgi:glycosyltransferase involved in cell wall biosynthesis/ubiquinone/menaquinone biosynthesis C-methylase UbiE
VDKAFFRRELSRFAPCGHEWIVREVENCLGQAVGLVDERRSGKTQAALKHKREGIMVEGNKADGIFKVSRPERSMEFTGERMTTAVEGEIEFEHFHRYCLARDLCPGLDVLDVASGEGYGSSILANVARSVIGADVDPGAIAHARTTYRGENLRFVEGSALDLPLGDASVDAVVSFETLEHVREHARFMEEVKRVLRPAGKLIVSTPERTVYSARGEPVNKYHVLELTEAEFDSLLRVNFKHVAMLYQRATLGSLIVKTEGGGPWRSYERRSLDSIEASGGLARAPFLIAIASEEDVSDIPSSVYLDRRRPGEVLGGYLQLPAYQSQAAGLSAEIGRLNDAAAARDAEIGRLIETAATRIAEIGRLNDHLSSRDMELQSVKTERDAQIVWLSDERTRLNGQLDGYAATLDALQGRYDKLQGRHDKLTRSFRWRFVDGLVHLPRTAGRAVRWPFIRVAFHKNGPPRGWLRRLGSRSAEPQSTGPSEEAPFGGQNAGPIPRAETLSLTQSPESTSSEETLQVHSPSVALDGRKATILVVAHEASRSGAPILALNLVQQLSARYNVVSLILGAGELTDHFRRASIDLYVVDRIHMAEKQFDDVIMNITSKFALKFGIVNSVESRMVLGVLNAKGVPTVSLVHEFSAYTRPRSAIPNVISFSTATVFSTKVTLENAVADFWLYPGTSIHVESQGKCIVPESPNLALGAAVEKTWLKSNMRPQGGNRKFLVLGAGAVQIRKGVDLFIECAAILKSQPGGDRFQFVWIGDGFDPEYELGYSVYLADQIRRAGVESQVKFLRSTSEIELAYQTADLLLLPSRLDPLPNVAIDALTLGLPVLCFEKTTGVADFLVDNGLGDQCVARYLDTHDLAGKVKALADSDDLRASVSDRSRATAKSAFDMNGYVSKIETIGIWAVGNEARIAQQVKTILASGRFRSDFFTDSTVDSLPEKKIIENYVRRMASGLHVRKPMPGFHPAVYSCEHRSEDWRNGDPFAEFLRSGLPEGPWLQRVIQNDGDRTRGLKRSARVALHIHAYYPDQLTGIAERLTLNASTPDLFISVTSEEAVAQTRQVLSGYRGRIAEVRTTPNLGRDIGSLLTEFGRSLCASYDIIGHLHTKKSAVLVNPEFSEAWNVFLLENLLGGQRAGAMLDSVLSSMETDPTIGMVFPDDPHVLSWTGNRENADSVASRIGLGDLPEQFNFPIGTMFWARSAVLSKFVELDLTWSDYPTEPVPYDGTLLHAIERLFGVVPGKMDMTCAVTNVRGVTR